MDWKENLPEDMRDSESLKKFTDVGSLAKSYLNIEKMASNSIRIPSDEATPEDKAEVYQKVMRHMPELMLKPNPDSTEQMTEFHRMLGVPENTDGYEANEIKNLGDDIIGELRQLAYKTNMTKAQFKAYVEQMDEMQGLTKQQQQESLTLQNAELKDKWGLATEDRLSVVEKHLEENGLGQLANYTPAQIEGHYKMALALKGVAQAHSQPTQHTSRLAPQEAKAQIAEIERNPDFLDGHQNPTEHRRLFLKKIELMRAANPELYS